MQNHPTRQAIPHYFTIFRFELILILEQDNLVKMK